MVNRTRGPVAVLGAGGHAKVVIATLREAGYEPSIVLDDDPACWGGRVLGVPTQGPVSAFSEHGITAAVIAIGSNAARQRVAEAVQGVEWITIVHPRAFVDTTVRLGRGTVVFAGAVIQPDTTCGDHVIVNTSASVDHDCVIEDFVHVAPGVRLAGGVRVARAAFVGIGSVVIPGRQIGANAVVGAGAVVITDVPAAATVVGVPARVLP